MELYLDIRQNADQKNCFYQFTNDGIFFCTEHEDGVDEFQVWIWKEFRITEITNIKQGDGFVQKYSGVFNGSPFVNLTLVKLKRMMVESCCMYQKHIRIFGPLILKYVSEMNIPIYETEQICGFTKNGWRLPDKFRVDSISNSIQDKILRMMRDTFKKGQLTQDEKKYIYNWVRDLYQKMTLQYKDILFAYGCIQPFFYAMRSTTKLLPIMCLGSTENTTGKSTGAYAISTKWWNNLKGKEVLTKDNFDTKSRALDYLATTTLAFVLDDVGKLDDSLQSEIKNYTTMESNVERKNPDGELLSDKPLTNPPILTWNEKPKMMDLIEMLSRSIYLPVFDKTDPIKGKIFNDHLEKLADGEVGRFIHDLTSNWDLNILLDFYEKTDIDPLIEQPRHNTIYRYLQMGKMFAKRWFDIDLDLSSVPDLLNNTMKLGNEEIFNLIQDQIIIGSQYEWAETNTPGKKIFIYNPLERWVTHPIYNHKLKKVEGYLYDSSNKIDLTNKLKRNSEMSLDYLYTILKIRWKEIEYKLISHEGHTARRIFIPKKCLEFTYEVEIQSHPKVEHQKIIMSESNDK